ncbi:Crp/Fnr family transcriptional regulator [Sphingomonas sp.]|jgi:CRP-like cAMP-binding protein|uniref:Crp/Fnr family transcriptional regulator n=1 Tax=Sphingomonas sp. TaxID=28214 RepID=UPI002D7F1826|nr:Crp/Fnr family transcriptional regulator [Sphingomonas sp.]HEU0044959.1 Crp/Fnr family transcriptional regulator [Sphingomonas sp.]
MSPIPQASVANRLLRLLSVEDYGLLEPALDRVHMPLRTALFEPHVPVEHVYFPEGGVSSIVTDQEGGDPVEYGLFGGEGMSGTPVLLGAGQSPHHCFVQMDGATMLRIGSDALLDACRQSFSLHGLLLRFVHVLAVQSAATASANAHYALPERLARWLLMCHDRTEHDRLELTHEFMAQMLAVRRSGVTVTLHTLEATGAIRSTRGLVTILDRQKLKDFAGESYGTPEREYNRLIAPFGLG